MQQIKTFFVSNGSQNRELDQCQQNHSLTKSPLTAAIPRLSSGLSTEVSAQATRPAPAKLVAFQWTKSGPPGAETIVSVPAWRRRNRRADTHAGLCLPPPQALNIPRPRSDHARGRKQQVPCGADLYARWWAGRRKLRMLRGLPRGAGDGLAAADIITPPLRNRRKPPARLAAVSGNRRSARC